MRFIGIINDEKYIERGASPFPIWKKKIKSMQNRKRINKVFEEREMKVYESGNCN